MPNVVAILNTLPWFAWIAIVAIVCETIRSVAKLIFKHHERVEMIRHGMNPDAVIVDANAKPKEYCEV